MPTTQGLRVRLASARRASRKNPLILRGVCSPLDAFGADPLVDFRLESPPVLDGLGFEFGRKLDRSLRGIGTQLMTPTADDEPGHFRHSPRISRVDGLPAATAR